ncbi:YdcF family protein [Granulosicoccus antarcticus]|uniref:DUF218 domain-containing protein n=1 Tax=Granulosicoccus antarcticus IMCC3135 TaxID=1192854 RepID=A0A2Z2NUQ3_9GAMM|nr:YdcF family protein [Granulosicoccus antarcticus]ASJ74983.1 hypothetical protein IMCC3135_24580 [Granulosicoccus antarcticus IMCC3135]
MGSLFRAWVIDPVALLFLFSLVLLIALSIKTRSRARSRRGSSSSRKVPVWPLVMLGLWVGVFLVCSAPVIVNPLIALMEDPYLEGVSCETGSHMVVLGGGVDSRIRNVGEFERMSPATLSRATAAARMLLSQKESDTHIIVAGGAVRQIAEAEVISAYLQQLGVAVERITQESGSSNTRENALNVAALLVDETVTGPVRLVTSAMHMPRALNTFRNVFAASGIRVCPVSVDVQAIKAVPAYALMPQSTAIARFDLLLHEAVALLAYRLKGWL